MFGRYAKTCRLSFGLTLALFATTALSAEWRIVEVTGVVRVAEPGRDAAAGRLNAVLPVGSSVTTAAGGRASLDNGLQRIVVGPNSRMTIAPETTSGMTRIAQDLGAILFQVDKKKAPHFRVDTPLLAAVVKGTTFTVVVDVQSDTVNVAEGLVEVRSNAGSMVQDVPGGATASVMRDAPQSVKMSAIAASAPDTAPAVIEPLDYGAVSGGLVEVGGLPGGAPQAQQAGAVAAGHRESQASLGAPSSQTTGVGSMSPATSMVAEQSRNSAHLTASLPGQSGGAAGAGNDHHGSVGGPGNGSAGGADPGNNGPNPGHGNAGVGLGNGNSGGGSNPGNGNPGGVSTNVGGGPGNGNSGGGTGNPGNGNSGNGNTSVDAGVALGNGNSGGGNGNASNGNSGNGNTSVDAGVVLGNGNSGGGTGNAGNSNTGGLSVDAGVGPGNGNSGAGNGNPGSGNAGGLGADAGVGLGNGNSGGGTGVSGNGGGGGGEAGANVTDPVTGLLNGLRVKK